MLESLRIKNVALAPELSVDWAPRINLIVGDNGLGKSFLLDLAWWSLTRTWAGAVALPSGTGVASIEYVVKGKTGKSASPVISKFRREDQSWRGEAKKPTMPGIVVYVRVDGGFSVWDPARNYWRTDPGRPAAYHFQAKEVWDGLDLGGLRVCEGLERDWVNWQEGRKPIFQALENVLESLSPPGERLKPGSPMRLYVGEGRDRPTILVGSQTVPVALASAGIRRVLAMAYFLVWVWNEHRVASKLLGREPDDRFVILIDEPETHLHPRWQRSIVPSLLSAIRSLAGNEEATAQIVLATHSPLVAASVEPLFDMDKDDLIHLALEKGQVELQQGGWTKQGDVTNWLVSETFGLEQARSMESERAIEAAEAFMRDGKSAVKGLETKSKIHKELQRLLPAHDPFWPRWLVTTGKVGAAE